jgi:methanogenic corrinoid protein MtbC1
LAGATLRAMCAGPQPSVPHLVALLERRDREQAIAEVERLYERTGSVEQVIELLAGAQREVGRRWQTNEWNVAQEHSATAIVDTVLALIAEQAATPATRAEIVVACAEGEWHVLPARMFAEQLRLNGFAPTFLGGSTPAGHLERFLDEVGPAALCISCSVPIFLLGAVHSIEAGHAAGIPVLAGGAGFGTDERRATALGADAWAANGQVATALLVDGIAPRRPVGPVAGRQDALALAAQRPDLVDAAMHRLRLQFPPVAGYDHYQLARTEEDLGYILQYIEASLLTGDERIVDEFVPWLSSVLVARGLSPTAVTLSLEILGSVVSEASLPGPQLLERAVTQARALAQT